MKPSSIAETEMMVSFRSAREDLLERFSCSARNELRPEIRSFRQLLTDIKIWAQAQGLNKLARACDWWEWYWHEREYGDSHFEPYREDEAIWAIPVDAVFWLESSLLRLALADGESLIMELTGASSVGSRTRVTILPPSNEFDVWDLFGRLLTEAGPTAHRALLSALIQATLTVELAVARPSFLSLIKRLPDCFEVETPRWENIAVRVNCPEGSVYRVSSGKFDPETLKWVTSESHHRVEKSTKEFNDDIADRIAELDHAA